jgi:hypothetical protein
VRLLSERLTEEPPPWLSPDRTAWAAAVTPWLIARLRRMFCAQAGGLSAAEGVDGSGDGAPPIVPIEELPPDAANPAFAPSE